MAQNSSSQISFLVLDSLSNGSKYGLEIIEYISQKTGGNYILKKPTLYSCLTRMEKKGLVSSSYWGESEMGGKRHYYTITNEGKRELEKLSIECSSLEFDAPESAYSSSNTQSAQIFNKENTNSNSSETTSSIEEKKPVFLQQDNLFDMVKPIQKTEEKPVLDDGMVENQIDIFSFQETLKETDSQTKQESEIALNETVENAVVDHDDGKFLDDTERLSPLQEEQNKIIYDTSSDFKRYRKKKSFSENQIEMAMVYDNAEEKELQKSRIDQLKNAMLQARQGNFEEISVAPQNEILQTRPNQSQIISSLETAQQPQPTQPTNFVKKEVEQQKDDGVFITHRVEANEIPIQKKISPTNIEVNVFDDNLPAPKRNSNLEPTYKDMMAKLFERKKEKLKEEPVTPAPTKIVEEKNVESFTDYSDLKKYYSNHGIDFKEYRKTSVKRHHNTNLLNLISTAILFLLSGIGSAVIFGCLVGAQLLKIETNFMFYTLPILFFVCFVYEFIKFKTVQSKKPSLKHNSIINWAIAILATVIIFTVNVLCGMQFETMSEFATTLIIPVWGVLLAFPVQYYVKKFLYKKYGK